MKTITITLNAEKTTKNTVKFAETCVSDFVPEKIGSLYIPKSTLAGIGYAGGAVVVKIGSPEAGSVKLMPEKPTKNTWKFNEESINEFVPEKIGTMYIPKSTLAELNYTGDAIYCGIELAK